MKTRLSVICVVLVWVLAATAHEPRKLSRAEEMAAVSTKVAPAQMERITQKNAATAEESAAAGEQLNRSRGVYAVSCRKCGKWWEKN